MASTATIPDIEETHAIKMPAFQKKERPIFQARNNRQKNRQNNPRDRTIESIHWQNGIGKNHIIPYYIMSNAKNDFDIKILSKNNKKRI